MQKLMVNGLVCPNGDCNLSIEVKRGMIIRSKDGLEAGKVAAVILNNENLKATHILLCRLPGINGYWMVPVDLIAEVREEIVQLSVLDTTIESLPLWHST